MKIVKLTCTSRGCPEQYEGILEGGEMLYARERHGEILIDVDGKELYSGFGNFCYDVLMNLFDFSEDIQDGTK